MTEEEIMAFLLREQQPPIPMGPDVTPVAQAQAQDPTTFPRPHVRGKPDFSPTGLASFANILREQTGAGQPGPERITDPTMPSDRTGGMSYEQLNEILARDLGKPTDYSKVQEVGRAQLESGRRGFLGALAMANAGGAEEQPLAKALFEKSLAQREGLRANAADVGYTNVDTGEFVENPELARSRREKLITGRIDAKTKDDLARAQLAARMTESDRTAYAKMMQQRIDELTIAVNAGRAEQLPELMRLKADLAAIVAGNKPPKPIPVTQEQQLNLNVSKVGTANRLLNSFKDEYAGMGALGGVRLTIDNALKSWGSDEPRAVWWANFKKALELADRHELFGATLTAGEEAAWKAAQEIQPGSSPAVVKKALDDLRHAVYENHKRTMQTLAREGKDPSAYEIPTWKGYAPRDQDTGQPARPPAPPPPGSVLPLSNPAPGGTPPAGGGLGTVPPEVQAQRDVTAGTIRAQESSPAQIAANIASVEAALKNPRLDGTQRGILRTELELLKRAREQAGRPPLASFNRG